jgi:hypothetical protein
MWGVNGTARVLIEYTAKASNKGLLLEPVDEKKDRFGFVMRPRGTVAIFIIRSKVHPLIEDNTWKPADHPSHPLPQRLTRTKRRKESEQAVAGL